jgi:D-arabinose 1-dehydrogenase-like Zn-dependent alcohol dehydrogenase
LDSADSTAEFPAFSVMTLLYRGLTIVGAIVGTPAETEEMLELAARKHIKPWIQTMPMKDANQAILDVDAGKPRYRIVLTA